MIGHIPIKHVDSEASRKFAHKQMLERIDYYTGQIEKAPSVAERIRLLREMNQEILHIEENGALELPIQQHTILPKADGSMDLQT